MYLMNDLYWMILD